MRDRENRQKTETSVKRRFLAFLAFFNKRFFFQIGGKGLRMSEFLFRKVGEPAYIRVFTYFRCFIPESSPAQVILGEEFVRVCVRDGVRKDVHSRPLEM